MEEHQLKFLLEHFRPSFQTSLEIRRQLNSLRKGQCPLVKRVQQVVLCRGFPEQLRWRFLDVKVVMNISKQVKTASQ